MLNRTEQAAASALEDLAVLAKTLANDIRNGHTVGGQSAYARAYWLRWWVGRNIVSRFPDMGPPARYQLNLLTEHYEKYLQYEPKDTN